MRKKKFILSGILLAILLACVWGGVQIIRNNSAEDTGFESKWREEGWEICEYSAYALREKYPTDIIWFGTWEGYEWEVPVRVETSVTPEVLAIRSGYRNAYIVINDTDGKCSLSDEEYQLILRTLKSDKRYHFIYGGADVVRVCNLGFGNAERLDTDDFSVAAYHYPGNDHFTTCFGVYMRSFIETEEEKQEPGVHYSFANYAFESLEEHYPQN